MRHKNSNGTSLLEVVLASSLLLLIAAALGGVLIFSFEGTAVAGARARALLLAEEGLEAVRNIRDDDFCGLSAGTYGLAVSGGKWSLSGTSDTTDGFTRSVEIANVDSWTKEVTARVAWQETAQRTGTVSLATRLAFWQDLANIWWNSSWQNRRKITFNNTTQTENLVDFPVLISLNSVTIDYGKTQDAGQDIRFVDPDDVIVSPPCVPALTLAHEIEQWNEAGNSYVWVKVKQINAGSNNTDYIWMYYNNAGASNGENIYSVWTNGYAGVWHLKEDPGGVAPQMQNSVANLNHGTVNGTAQAVGKIGPALNFDAVADYVDLTSNLDDIQPITVSAWMNPVDVTVDRTFVGKDCIGPGNWCFGIEGFPDGTLEFTKNYAIAELIRDGPSILLPAVWQHVAATWDGSAPATSIHLYLNGVEPVYVGSNGIGFENSDAALNLRIGAQGTGAESFPGILDEVRISNVVRTTDWMRAEYQSTNGVYAFTTVGAEEAP